MSDVPGVGARIRVVLADDHPVVLAGIKALLQAAPEIDVVGEATSGATALEMIRACMPDVAVLDISMPGVTGLDLARRLALECPAVRVIALTMHEDRAYVRPLLDAGARGYLLKRSAAEDLVRAVRAVSAGGMVLDPAVADKAFDHRTGFVRATAGTAELSPRETNVLYCTARGLGNKEIAARLEVSVKTVETYKARACEKLGLHSRAAIVRYGVAQGWLDIITDPPR